MRLLLIIFFGFVSTAIADQYESPEALVAEMQRLMQTDCQLECHVKLADMYTERYLNAQREVVLAALEEPATREVMTQSFFGRMIDLHALKKMPPQEFFAHQTWNSWKGAPADFLIRTVTITDLDFEADKAIASINKSGMKANPDYVEEGLMSFVRTPQGWKIDSEH